MRWRTFDLTGPPACTPAETPEGLARGFWRLSLMRFLALTLCASRTTFIWKVKKTLCCHSSVSGRARPGKARSFDGCRVLAGHRVMAKSAPDRTYRESVMPQRVQFPDAIEPL